MRRHLLSAGDIDAALARELFVSAASMGEVCSRQVPKVPVLVGRTVASMFFEDSTRTRLSFETAARRLSADTLTFTASTSSLKKGESLRDTVETVAALGADAVVVRHSSAGVPMQISRFADVTVINAGDGAHQHPTQALLDAFTISEELSLDGDLSGVRVVIVGDVAHSRVARSDVALLTTLGASVVLCGPPTMLPAGLEGPNVAMSTDLDAEIGSCDVLCMLRVQHERLARPSAPPAGDYRMRFGLTPARAARLPARALLLHPGPMNRDTEMLVDPAALPQSRILTQVRNGVAVRMAVLAWLLTGETVR
jgi:aspartate carbamoyltransferase catalytic subunit